jgi:hypothetical protein
MSTEGIEKDHPAVVNRIVLEAVTTTPESATGTEMEEGKEIVAVTVVAIITLSGIAAEIDVNIQ